MTTAGEKQPKAGRLRLCPYDRGRAVEYARQWALRRNGFFANFSGQGGDCTNFVSEAVYAGSCVMNFEPIFGWYFITLENRAPAWTGVEAFYDFMTGNGDFAPTALRPGPFGAVVPREFAEPGDVIQLSDADGDFYHTVIITGFAGEEILISAHSNDVLDRPLSSYANVGERVIHIMGVAVPDPFPDEKSDKPWQPGAADGEEFSPGGCFARLIAGPPEPKA